VTWRPPAGLVVVAALIVATTAQAAAETRLGFQPSSRVLLSGSSNLHGWSCSTTDLAGSLWLSADPDQMLDIVERLESLAITQGRVPAPAVPQGLDARFLLEIPIAALDCGRRGIEQDLQQTLDAARHPVIRYRFTRVESAELERRSGGELPVFALRVHGEMSLAGTTRPVSFEVLGRRTGLHTFQLSGRIPLAMTHFGIEPPTALLGLIRVADALSVDVRLVLDLDATSAAALRSTVADEAAAGRERGR
jgi:hypothetical protein